MPEMIQENDYSLLLKNFNYNISNVTKAWSHYTLDRSNNFKTLNSSSLVCIDKLGNININNNTNGNGNGKGFMCHRLEYLLNNETKNYLKTQKRFFCEVCELFNGKNYPTHLDDKCKCDNNINNQHPPLVGGIYIHAIKKQFYENEL